MLLRGFWLAVVNLTLAWVERTGTHRTKTAPGAVDVPAASGNSDPPGRNKAAAAHRQPHADLPHAAPAPAMGASIIPR